MQQTYQQALDYLLNRLPMYQRQGKAAFRADLNNAQQLDAYLGFPHRQFKSVHVAGTNGKGSVCHYIASVLMEAGYKVGLHTSPHLTDYRERVLVNGKKITREHVLAFVQQHREFFETLKPSFFEISVCMAFWYFALESVDFAIIEVGMGGRLDATNIINPVLSVITNIGLDHTGFLGETHAQIAKEKAGIIKPGVPVIIGETQQKTTDVFRRIANENKSKVIFADQLQPSACTNFDTLYQQRNWNTAYHALRTLENNQKLSIPTDAYNKGLIDVKKNTGYRGRWHVLQQSPLIVADTAHNAEGLRYVIDKIVALNKHKVCVVLSFVNDKDLSKALALFPGNWDYIATQSGVERSLSAHELFLAMQEYGFNVRKNRNPEKALTEAQQMTGPEGLIYVGGSTFLVADILNIKKM